MPRYLDQFRASRRAGVPIVVIRTPDYTAVIDELKKFYNEKDTPILRWDIARGVLGGNELGNKAAAEINQNDMNQAPEMATGNPVDALQKTLKKSPPGSIIFMLNLQIPLESKDVSRIMVIQGIWNCRDAFKTTRRTLVLLVPDLQVPPELNNDVITLDVDLPTNDELKIVVEKQVAAAKLPKQSPEIISKAVDAISGLSEFSAEQVTATSLSLQGKGLDLAEMWSHKRSIIRQTGGLSVYSGPKVGFDDLGGLEQMKKYLRMIISGKNRPKLVVLLDEFEKQTAGVSGSTGVEADAVGQLLTGIQDNGWDGILLPGFPGTGKTECGKAMGAEAGGLFLTFDMGGMKDKFVGNSEKMIRSALKMLRAMGGENVFWIATCNSMAALKPELKRRFAYGTFFFDLPTEEEQTPIWGIYTKKFSIAPQKLPDCTGWTGAEIKSCCKRADEFGITLLKAAEFVTPVARSMGDEVKKLRESAHRKYLSATTNGFYDMHNSNVEDACSEIRQIGTE